MKRWVVGIIGVCVGSAALAQQKDSNVVASNGVQVHVVSDDFAGRAEYTAPKIDLADSEGFILVAAIKRPERLTPVFATGSVYYRGEWRRYDQAVLRGGETVAATFGDRDVVTCSGSRYGGCSLREGFQLNLTTEQIAKYTENGQVVVQLRASGLYPVMLTIPVSYFDAVAEVSQQPSDR